MFPSEEIAQTTESLEQLPRTYDHKSAISERRQQIIQQKYMEKQTDALPVLTPDDTGALTSSSLPATSSSPSPIAKVAWRQVLQLRDENRRLRGELDVLRVQTQGGIDNEQEQQDTFDAQMTLIHNGYQQEISHFQQHLQETLNERNHLQQQYRDLTQQHQTLTTQFQQAVETAAQQRIRDLTTTGSTHPDETAPWLRQIMYEAEARAHQAGDKQLKELLYLKRELKRIGGALEEERRQLSEERQNLVTFQHSVSEQASLRQKNLQARLYARWRVASVATSLGLVALLLILQCVCLALFHVPIVATLMLALATPIVVCTLLAFILASPLAFLKHMYRSLPRRVKQGA